MGHDFILHIFQLQVLRRLLRLHFEEMKTKGCLKYRTRFPRRSREGHLLKIGGHLTFAKGRKLTAPRLATRIIRNFLSNFFKSFPFVDAGQGCFGHLLFLCFCRRIRRGIYFDQNMLGLDRFVPLPQLRIF